LAVSLTKESLEQGENGDQSTEDILQVITNLGGLREQGILSEEEFNQKKEELLSRL
jgi:hypothetical protein